VISACGSGDNGRMISFFTPASGAATFAAVAKHCTEQLGRRFTIQQFSLPRSSDDQRLQLARRLSANDRTVDVMALDVIWTAEFSSQHWLYDLSSYVQANASKYIAAPLQTVHYGGKYWGVPETSDAAFLYYNKAKVKTPPTTWQQVYSQAKTLGGIVYQGAPYEGLTCDFLELAFAAGGQVLNAAGNKSAIDSPQNLAALTLMVNGIKDGSAPQSVTTYMEPETDQAWATGKYAFMRNWTYAYAADNTGSMAGKMGVAVLPTFAGGTGANILGGHNTVISAYSKNPGLALKFADFYASPAFQKELILKYSEASVIPGVYSDPDVKKAIPYAAQLLKALEQAHARPVSPVYPQISEAIYTNVNNALAGRMSPSAALKAADTAINSALSTF
jgi:multiple sugar transport system substrate-binding protein